MGHVALYRRFRPSTFDEIVEQKHAVSALRQAVISGSIAHAYLFSGTRGTGKTSIAKIFSRAVNCLSPQNGNPCNQCEICRGILDGTLMDVIEMDAASNNSVDNIRRVCDEVMFLPSRAKYKVYIIDEVHMLSGGAFNALLKTLEEPPAHAIFILATTEPHRIPATIISRCQRYDFRRIPTESMIERLREIADAQNVSIEPEALSTIANLSDGAMRDAISLLDQVSTGAAATIVRDDVLRITGVVDDTFLFQMAEAVLSDDALSIISLTDQLIMDGRDIIRFTLDLAHYFRDALIVKLAPAEIQLVQASSAAIGQMHQIGGSVSERSLMDVITRLSSLVSELKWSPEMRTSFEIALLSFGFSRHNDAEVSPDAVTRSFSKTASSSAPLKKAPSAPAPTPAPETRQIPEPRPISEPGPASGDKPGMQDLIHGMTPPPFDEPGVPVEAAAAAANVKPAFSIQDPARSTIQAPIPSKSGTQEADPAENGSGYMAPPPFNPVPSSVMPAPSDISAQVSFSEFPEPPDISSFPEPPDLSGFPEPPDISEYPEQTRLSDFPEPPSLPYIPEPPVASEPDRQQLTPQVSVSTESPDRSLSADPGTVTLPADDSVSTSSLPLSELWDALLHRWMDSMFSDVLQLKNASIRLDGKSFFVLFPDSYGPYVHGLTGRPEYKTIMKDVQTVIGGVDNVLIRTLSEDHGSNLSEAGEDTTEIKPARAAWVNDILRFAQEEGIPVETLDEL